MLNIVNTELKLVASAPNGKPWMLSFHFDNIIAETGSNQMSFWYREHPTMLAIQHMREDAMLWANSHPVIDPFDVYDRSELPPMPKHLTVFDNKPVTGNTPHELWEAIQHGAIVCTDVDKHIASIRPANSTETCYVFWDVVGLMSMPYESEAVVRQALATYIKYYL